MGKRDSRGAGYGRVEYVPLGAGNSSGCSYCVPIPTGRADLAPVRLGADDGETRLGASPQMQQ